MVNNDITFDETQEVTIEMQKNHIAWNISERLITFFLIAFSWRIPGQIWRYLNLYSISVRIVLSDEAINQMITISNLMTEVKESIHEKIKEINNHEDTLLEVISYNILRVMCTSK